MDEQKNPVLKALFAWGGVGFSKYLEAVGIHSWGDVAAMFAALYSLFLIIDWIWKKVSNR